MRMRVSEVEKKSKRKRRIGNMIETLEDVLFVDELNSLSFGVQSSEKSADKVDVASDHGLGKWSSGVDLFLGIDGLRGSGL